MKADPSRNSPHGKIDIAIGTHRLFSKDVEFRDLGLLIVDEEQRFGVRHKERLKQMRKNVHVLSMSATPIPRTLHMSLLGIRDMSVIETPPKDRLAIHTVVAHFDPDLIRTAIEQELAAGGQVYFVHNRVDSIFTRAAWIQELVPDCRIGVGHGQMDEEELERVLLGFMRHEYDVFVCTTIVENGLDIPLANTIDHRECRALRPFGAVPSCAAAWAGPIAEPTLICWSRADTELTRNRPQAPGRAARIFGSGRRLQDRRARSGIARRRQPAGRRAARPHRGRRLRHLSALCSKKPSRN